MRDPNYRDAWERQAGYCSSPSSTLMTEDCSARTRDPLKTNLEDLLLVKAGLSHPFSCSPQHFSWENKSTTKKRAREDVKEILDDTDFLLIEEGSEDKMDECDLQFVPYPTPINPFSMKIVEHLPIDETARSIPFSSEQRQLLRELFRSGKEGSDYETADPLLSPPIPSYATSSSLTEGDEQGIQTGKSLDSTHKKPRAVGCKKESLKVAESDDDCSDQKARSRIRDYQEDAWNEKFKELCQFREENGHCFVPHNWSANPQLFQWVKRQRYLYKIKKEKQGGRSSAMTDEREMKLEEIGFVWAIQETAWEERYRELEAFRKVHGHCNVPSTFRDNQSLSVWVKCQRRQRKLFQRGVRCFITAERIERLNRIGFLWNVRKKCKTDI